MGVHCRNPLFLCTFRGAHGSRSDISKWGVLMLPDDAGPSQWRSTANGDLFALTYSSSRPAGIIRFDVAGNLDPSFGTGGVVVPQCGSCFLETFTLLADQRIALRRPASRVIPW